MRGATRVWIGLGSNLPPSRAFLQAAIARLRSRPAIVLRRLSSVRRTRPVGPVVDQPFFLNAVAEIETRCSAPALLEICLEIERALGRDRRDEVPQGPRTIDLDILLYGDRVVERPNLVIPHPRVAERRFTLDPLAELVPEGLHPVLGRTWRALRRELMACDPSGGGPATVPARTMTPSG